jgi:hypothetical protein
MKHSSLRQTCSWTQDIIRICSTFVEDRIGCRFGNGTVVPESMQPQICPASQPATVVPCTACQFCEDLMQHRKCSGHGRCVDNRCACSTGWAGPVCSVPSVQCKTGVVDVKGLCCSSSVLDASGQCCEGEHPVLDRSGHCCLSGVLDACGMCDGNGVVLDATGQCCEVWPTCTNQIC